MFRRKLRRVEPSVRLSLAAATDRAWRQMRAACEPLEGRRLLASTPFGGTAPVLPAIIQFENFDNGGQGVAYYDATAANQGGQYRTSERVDIETTSDAGGGYDVSFALPGEYLNYTLKVPTTGSYNFAFRVASPSAGTFHLSVDGQNVTGAITAPNTGGFQNWTTVTKAGVNLTAGQHVFTVTMDSASQSWDPYVANFNWFQVTQNNPPPPPAQPTVSIAATDPNAAEQNRDPGVFTITRSGDTSAALTVPISYGGTATYASDYNQAPTAVTIPAGQTSATVTITPVDDTLVEGNETVLATIGSGTGYTLASPTSATITIADNDQPPPQSGSPKPFSGVPTAVPGLIELENYDLGGEGVAYHDTTANNEGLAYRTSEGVDVEPASDTNGGYDVAYTHAGEWIGYTVNVASAGLYDFDTRVANYGGGGAFHVEVDGQNVTGTLAVPDTGGFQKYTDVLKNGVQLAAGPHFLKLVMDGNSQYGFSGNYNWLKLTAEPPPAQQGAFGGTPATIPGTIQAENYDTGGEGVAYHDTTANNEGLAYRTGANEGVDVEPTADAGGGYDVGWAHAGEWMEYTVTVPTASTYNFDARVAHGGTYGGAFHVEFNGVNQTGTLTIPATGGWQTYTDVTKNGLSLAAGTYVMKVAIDADGQYGFAGNFNWFKLTPASVGTTPPTVTVAATTPNASEAGPTAGAFTLTRTGGDASQPLTVNFTLGGTATNGSDYAALPTSVTIPAGATSAVVTVNPIDDSLVEGNETVILTLQPATAYNLGSATTGTVTIADNDVGNGAQPDLQLRNYGDTAYSGVNVINADGTNQIRGQDQPFLPSIFQVRVTNNGTVADSFNITGPSSTSANWRISYYDSQVQGRSGGNDVTAAVTAAGGWNTGTLQPGQSKDFRFEVAASPYAPANDQYGVTLTATAADDPTKIDVIKAIAINDVRREVEVRRRNFAAANGESGTYDFDVQNYGNIADQYRITATGSGTGYTVKYFNAYNGAGTDVTSAVTGTGYVTSPIGFHALQNMSAQITSTDGQVHPVNLTVTSINDPTVTRTITISNAAPAAAAPSFFPIGVWSQPAYLMSYWKQQGVNTMVGYDSFGGQDSIDAWSQVAVDKGLYMIRQPRPNPADDANQQNLLAFLQPDEEELPWNNYSPAQAQQAYNAWKQAAPNIPVLANFDGSELMGWQRDVPFSNYAAYAQSADWDSSGVYPISGWNRPDDLDVPGRALDRLEAISQGAPQFAVIETSDQLGTWLPPGSPAPKAAQVRAEIWDAIVHGAKGIIYFPQSFTPSFKYENTAPDVSAEITTQNARLTSIGAALESAIDPTTLGVTANAPLEATWRSYGGHSYFIVFNYSNATTTQQFTLNGVNAATTATVQGENRNVSLTNGTVTDTFAPYEAHIYVV